MTDKHLSCSTNRSKNLRTISGALVLTAIQESFVNHSFTSATIITRESFNLSSSNLLFEVRASFPTSQDVFGQLLLIPEQDLFDKGHFKRKNINGKVSILMNIENTIKAGFSNVYRVYAQPFVKSPEIDVFTRFLIKFNQWDRIFTLFWSLNGSVNTASSNSLKIPCSNNEACTILLNKGEFRLVIDLMVGNLLQGGHDDKFIQNSRNWLCTSMIIDYIKVYDFSTFEDLDEFEFFNSSVEKSAKDICNQVTIKLDEKQKIQTWKNPLYLIISILVIAFLLLSFIAYRMCKIIKAMRKVNNHNLMELENVLTMRNNSIYTRSSQVLNEYESIPCTDSMYASELDNFDPQK